MTGPGTEALVEQAWTLVESGDGAQAQRLFQKVVEVDPENAEAWMMTGVLHAQAGALDQARACLDRALRIDPDYADPYLHLARMELGAGQAGAALEYVRKAVASDGDYPEALQLLAELSARSGDAGGAESAYRRLLALEPGRADIHNRLAAVLSAGNRFDEALQACDEALSLDPANPEIFANRGNVHFRRGDMPAAIESFRRALELSPDFAGARLNLGNALREKGDLHEAEDCYRRLLQDNPGFHEARLSLCECHLKSGELEQALDCYDRVLNAASDHPVALLNKGVVLYHLARYAESLEALKRLVQVDARHKDGWFNRGLVEKRLGMFEEALASYRKALSLSPDNPDIRASLALLELSLGNYAEGWRYYVSRKSVRDRAPLDPRDLAGNLDGRRILLVKEQGIGDEIFFLRFARLLKDRGAWLGCRTDRKISSIVGRLPFLDLTVAESERPPAADLIVAVGDLPRLLGLNDARAFPPPVGLTVLPEARRKLEARLQGTGAGPLIGVTWWAGTPTTGFTLSDRLSYREVPFHLLAKILRPVDARVVILQRAPDAAELEAFSLQLGRGVIDMSDLNDDLETMLALLDRLDDCVGVDNTNMHLRVGLGRSGRILVPHPPEWRMLTAGASSPWFPGFSLYRQRADGDWTGATAQLEKDLADSLSPG